MRRWGAHAAAIAALLMGPVVFGWPATAGVQDEDSAAAKLAALKDEGGVLYQRDCATCHGAEGQGDGAPALAANMNLANKDLVIKRILGGTTDGGMDPFAAALTDHQIAAVATFVRNAWENDDGIVLDADVKPLREQYEKDRSAAKK